MLPRSSSTNSQRRSSILKPPKTRQPFQDLDFNTSSPEISPESNRKRRVSFAEKKHVKEFCDHKEQGTIWDSTYEEPDQNVSKSTETSRENADCVNPGIRQNENVDIAVDEAGFNYHTSKNKTYVIMDQSSVGNTSKRILFNSETDLEFTDVIVPCSRGTSNDLMSRTIFCQDVDLEITEAIGGIEPTVSVRTIANLQPRGISDYDCIEKDLKSTEKTVLFDSSGGEMNFTEVISGRKISTLIPQNLDTYKELEQTNSMIENETIIFDDSIMELTLTRSQTDIQTDFPQGAGNDVGKENIRSSEIYDGSNCKELQAGNKTVFFNDFGCDMTEAINTVLHPVSEINSAKETLTGEIQTTINTGMKAHVDLQAGVNSCTVSEEKNLSNGSDSTLTISDTHSNKTIIFNDFGCEMTEAINTIKSGPAQAEITGEIIVAEQIVPQQLIPMNRITDVETETGSLSSKTGAESLLKLMSGCNNRTEFFNDSAMEFTAAITRGNNLENKVDEDITVERNKTQIFHNCDVDITENVRAAICSLSSGSNSEERADLLDTESEHSEGQSKKKRKSYEIEAGFDYIKASNSLMNKSSGHDLVQSLARDDAIHVLNDYSDPNCKRLKITEEDCLTVEDHFVSAEPQLLDNLTNTMVHTSLPNSQDLPETQIQIPVNVEAEEDCVTGLPGECGKSTGDLVVADSNCSDDRKKSMIADNVEAEGKESPKTAEDVSEEECSFMEATLADINSDSESEIRELSRVYDKRRQSLIEKSNDVQSRLEPNECLDHNDNCCFVMFSEELEKQAKSNGCIWTIRSLDEKKVLIDFISKSLVVIVHLEATAELTIPRTIKDIRIVSLLADSECGDISMIHSILLKKLDPDNLKRLHRTTQDILPLLEFISHRVKLLLDFMYEFDKLQDLHLINRSGNRISFRLHSYKVQLVIKITIDLEPFEDIGPNDVEVECILGNIREKDIKQLITSVKKDHKFLTNCINDIKEYIAVVVEK